MKKKKVEDSPEEDSRTIKKKWMLAQDQDAYREHVWMATDLGTRFVAVTEDVSRATPHW